MRIYYNYISYTICIILKWYTQINIPRICDIIFALLLPPARPGVPAVLRLGAEDGPAARANISLSLSLSLYIYTYIYIYICVHTSTHIHVYTHISSRI